MGRTISIRCRENYDEDRTFTDSQNIYQKIAINYKVRGKKNKNKNTNFTGEKPRMSRISYYKSVFPF